MAKFSKKKDQIVKEPLQKYEQSYQLPRKEIMLNNFLGGVTWAVGSVVGLSLLFGILGLLAQYIDLVPVIGDFIAEIISYIELRNPRN